KLHSVNRKSRARTPLPASHYVRGQLKRRPREGNSVMVGISTRWLLGGPAVVLFLSAAIAQTTMTVAGSATYRERIALPPNAVFEVTLEDVARADAPAEVIGRTRLDQPGQPPFHFSIQYDPARIVESHRYHLRARVTVAGDLMFTTDQSYPVLTQGNGSQV